MTNLFDTIFSALPADSGRQLGGHLGDPADAALKGLSGAVPLLLSAFAARAACADDLDGLLDLVCEGLEGGSDLLANPAPLLSGAAAATGPGRLAEGILGPRFETVNAEVARYFGLRLTSSRALLHMAGPLIAGGIGRVLGSNPSAPAIRDLLLAQSASYVSALPAELRQLVVPVEPESISMVGNVTRPALWKWLLLLLVALAVLAWLFQGRPGPSFFLPEADDSAVEHASVDTAPVGEPQLQLMRADQPEAYIAADDLAGAEEELAVGLF